MARSQLQKIMKSIIKNKKKDNESNTKSSIPLLVKNYLGRIAEGLYREKKWSHSEIDTFFQHLNFFVPRRTLSRWIKSTESLGAAVPYGSSLGAAPLLEEWQEEIVAGFVLECNLKLEVVHCCTVVSYVHKSFGIHMTAATAGNYLAKLGFSVHELKQRADGYITDRESLIEMYMKWLLQHRLTVKACMVCSVDFTYTSHRTRRVYGYAPKGDNNPEGKKGISRFTNCILTCVWADGVLRTPCMLFTYNSQFHRDRRYTPHREATTVTLDKTLATYGIEPERVVYVGSAKGQKKTYCAESPALVRRFFEYYGFLGKDITIFSDDGKCFVENGTDVFEQMGFSNHIKYIPALHHYTSPNDNNVHGAAKKIWREQLVDHSEDIKSSIALMSYIDQQSAHSKLYFNKNIQFGPPYGLKVVRKDAEELCGKSIKDLSLERLVAFRIFEGLDERGDHVDVSRELSDHLDGLYYQRNKN
jgi:transposase